MAMNGVIDIYIYGSMATNDVIDIYIYEGMDNVIDIYIYEGISEGRLRTTTSPSHARQPTALHVIRANPVLYCRPQ